MTEGAVSAPERRAGMRSLIEESFFVRVAELSERFEVSAVTVRGDLEALENEGGIRRIRGGAMPTGQLAERPFELSQVDAAEQKARIAAAALRELEPGMSVLLDVGTTTAAIARALVADASAHGLTVITNGLAIALALEPALDRLDVVVTGGSLRQLQHSLVAPLADTVLGRVHADIAFIGCTGVDGRGGVTNINLPEADVKRSMMAASSRNVIVADSSKIGRVHLGRVADAPQIDLLITGDDSAPAALTALRDGGCGPIVTV
ncbi:DeoR/GlpR family DNA-binding transcription regulator [Gryllotalpicola reticulitermitis]|uniref:DeoR/GlpR family DNA-binding transcription regulator n=1 Tax=Gryllotalpicola reticulitermitis TaxID=1184153 RepID=A0ABV8Q1I0_9MICO